MKATTQPLPTPKLETIGFCGVDDTILDPMDLVAISLQYPLVEWGVLFRPDKVGKVPRYATLTWIERFCQIIQEEEKKQRTNGDGGIVAVRLAAHLCGIHVNNILSSSSSNSAANDVDTLLDKLVTWGFTRVQINATAVNGVDTNYDAKVAAESFLRTSIKYSQLEFIVQCNTETKPLWSALLQLQQQQQQQQQQQRSNVNNIVFLHDESKGTGTTTTRWPTDSQFISSGISRSGDGKTMGYAGGINPTNILSIISSASKACLISGGTQFWLDMESGVRTTKTVNRVVPGRRRRYAEVDTFDLDKCMECINLLCDAGWIDRPMGRKKVGKEEVTKSTSAPAPSSSLSTEEQTCGCCSLS